jgi:hypothetical protein
VRFLLGLTILATITFAHAAELRCVTEVPFSFQDGLIRLQIHVPQSVEPLNFLLDSGAGVSTINLGTAQKLGLKRARQVSVQGVGATTVGYWPQHLSATVGELPLPKDYLAVDLSELSGSCQCPVDGLLGADFFRDRVVQIDFAARKIRLPSASIPAAGAETLPLRIRHGAFRIPIRINGGARQWVRLDTGCASALHWVTDRVELQGQPAELAIALTRLSVPVIRASVQLGQDTFDSVPTGLHARPIFPGEAGLLGNGLLSRFASVVIDAKAGQLTLQMRADVK